MLTWFAQLSNLLSNLFVTQPRELAGASTSLKFNDSFKPVIKVFFITYSVLSWVKARILYYVNNWVYTTNHKRIAVNYFWFVIFSGICGMVLATIIRLEMAYPGVGILAGDSLQYLSVVTAHAVIMVFFMIMPLLFGAFGNFLLPTQLGVHDVAFPRLNSVAFWFLPGGLIMLCQLVCLDRRYQRMNCFNIREIQTLLKARFYADLMNESSRHLFLSRTTLNLRFKLQDLSFLNLNSVLANRYGLFTGLLTKSQQYNTPLTQSSSVQWFAPSVFAGTAASLPTTTPYLTLIELFNAGSPTTTLFTKSEWNWSMNTGLLQGAPSISASYLAPISLSKGLLGTFSFPESLSGLVARVVSSAAVFRETLVLETNWYLVCTNLIDNSLSTWAKTFFTVFNRGVNSQQTVQYLTNSFSTESLENQHILGKQESSANYRFQRLQNPVFKYDFKLGNYMPDENKVKSPFLYTTIHDLTTGVRKANWAYSADFLKFVQGDLSTYLGYYNSLIKQSSVSKATNNFLSDISSSHSANDPFYATLSHSAGIYNYFFLLSDSTQFVNHRWSAVNTLDQKLYKMFLTNSMQQRIHGNWRQLKFTREAWRCKLLAARHQNTLHKRYVNEDSTVWSVERNAKDVLPGWAMITPFSARTRFTAIGKVDLGLMGVFLVLNSSIVASSNFLITYRYLSTLNNRKMRDARSFFTEGVMVASWMMIAANPMLAIGILMLLSDRHWQTSFFDYSGGGDTVMFQHMFWFFGHPEVYVIMIPTFGFNNTILSFYLRKRVSARASLLYSMYTIALLGFFVWGHHMYMVGLAHTTRMLFSTLTVMISVPAATKLMHWCVTLVNSTFAVELPFLFQLFFIFFFVSGGISGMAVAHTGMDVLFHDSFYVVGHFHVMFAGAAMFGSFGAFYFYFPAIWGVKFSRTWGYIHCLYYLIGQLMTVIPMIWLGYSGMPRRVLDYPASMGGWHSVASAGHLISVGAMFAFFIMLFDSLRQGRAATRNTFGVSRFNTRLNFYLYVGARMLFLQRKSWHLSRFNQHKSIKLNSGNYTNYEYYETTLFSYSLVKSASK